MSVNNSSPDLTQHAPRSPRLRLGGYALLPRIIDKGHASLTGKLGAYHYRGVGMDRHFFKFVGLDPESLKQELLKVEVTARCWRGFRRTQNSSVSPGRFWPGANGSQSAHRTAMQKRFLNSPKWWRS